MPCETRERVTEKNCEFFFSSSSRSHERESVGLSLALSIFAFSLSPSFFYPRATVSPPLSDAIRARRRQDEHLQAPLRSRRGVEICARGRESVRHGMHPLVARHFFFLGHDDKEGAAGAAGAASSSKISSSKFRAAFPPSPSRSKPLTCIAAMATAARANLPVSLVASIVCFDLGK